jgi:hypothetical protein
MNPELRALSQLLASHDWYYDYSDDHRVWRRGVAQRDAILAEQQRVVRAGLATEEEVQRLVDQHRPSVG